MVLQVGSWTQGPRPCSVKNLLLRNSKTCKPDQFWQNSPRNAMAQKRTVLPIMMMVVVMIKCT